MSNAITPAQRELLKLFSFDDSDDFANEIKHVLTQHFLSKIDAETERLWNNGVLNQEKLDSLRAENLHDTNYQRGATCN